jgi:hypothetical protein
MRMEGGMMRTTLPTEEDNLDPITLVAMVFLRGSGSSAWPSM